MPKENLWDRVQIFRSAPGGGKTSLFRVFTPAALLTLHGFRANEDYKELYQRMRDLGVLSDNGPHLLGIMLSCARNYAMLDDLGFDQSRKDRLFFSLLNARLMLATLRGALTLKNLRYPEDLERVNILAPAYGDFPVHVPVPGSGKDLYDWACSIERGICETIDSFNPSYHEALQGHDTLYVLSLMKPDCILCEGVPIVDRILVMFDDVHKLTALQRQKLLETLFDYRPSVGIWLAERLEALSPDELLAPGATTGREYGKPINLEDFWRTSANSRRFEYVITNIADKRSRLAYDAQIESFAGCLQEFLDGTEWQDRFNEAIKIISERIRTKIRSTKRYEKWVEDREMLEGTPRQRAIAWRALEILIERDIRKIQLSFDFGLPLEHEELEQKESFSVRAAAEFFIAREFNVPYYFGISRLTTLASSNIEQFLAFAGDLFEEIISAALLKRQTILTPQRQESILKEAVQQRWEEIPRKIPNGREVQKFLEAIHQCARWETDRPNAPYAPGVTGIALTMEDRDKLIDPKVRLVHPEYERLILILSACISHNLLEASLDRSQGQKGKTWMILYLNRWLCLKFGLPLQYGGWRPKTPAELCKWLDQGFRPPKKNGGGLL
ncbi:MAG: hypothetical protein K6U04_07095 [Armatimonadetes bacterium]|nr:hypothetical protein [Armatimonadota bacterium]